MTTDGEQLRGKTRQCEAAARRRRREEKTDRRREGEREGGRNFHLGKLPATIKIRWMRAEERASRLCARNGKKERKKKERRRGAFFSPSIMIKRGRFGDY